MKKARPLRVRRRMAAPGEGMDTVSGRGGRRPWRGSLPERLAGRGRPAALPGRLLVLGVLRPGRRPRRLRRARLGRHRCRTRRPCGAAGCGGQDPVAGAARRRCRRRGGRRGVRRPRHRRHRPVCHPGPHQHARTRGRHMDPRHRGGVRRLRRRRTGPLRAFRGRDGGESGGRPRGLVRTPGRELGRRSGHGPGRGPRPWARPRPRARTRPRPRTRTPLSSRPPLPLRPSRPARASSWPARS